MLEGDGHKRTQHDPTDHVLELLHAQVLRDDEDLLAVLVRAEDLGALADDEHAVVGVEEPEEVVRVRDDVARRVLVGGHGVDLRRA